VLETGRVEEAPQTPLSPIPLPCGERVLLPQLSVEALTALHAEAVPSQVVVPA